MTNMNDVFFSACSVSILKSVTYQDVICILWVFSNTENGFNTFFRQSGFIMNICWYSKRNVDLVVVVVFEYGFGIFYSLSGFSMYICKLPESNVDPVSADVYTVRIFFSLSDLIILICAIYRLFSNMDDVFFSAYPVLI